jgi:hypothetical protein
VGGPCWCCDGKIVSACGKRKKRNEHRHFGGCLVAQAEKLFSPQRLLSKWACCHCCWQVSNGAGLGRASEQETLHANMQEHPALYCFTQSLLLLADFLRTNRKRHTWLQTTTSGRKSRTISKAVTRSLAGMGILRVRVQTCVCVMCACVCMCVCNVCVCVYVCV